MDLTRLRDPWDRLTQNNAFRVGTVYAGASWFIIEALDTLGGSTSTIRVVALVLGVGFLVVVPVVWVIERRVAADAAASGTPDAAAHRDVGAGPAPRPRRRGTRRWAGAVALLVLLAAGAWWAGASQAAGAVPDAATRLAVLPFHATGSDAVRELGVGMVDLLSAAMDDVAGIRTVSGRTVLARTGESRGPLELDDALSIGARLGAGSILTGSVTAVSGRVRLHGEVLSVEDGAVLASADAEGSEDDILPVADELAVRLLREMWQSSDPVPTVWTAALTTRSPAALRAYLEGEHHLRSMRTDSAADAFREALDHDSTFALAWLRLANSTGWTRPGRPAESLERRRQYLEAAFRFADRLPTRERDMLGAYRLVLDGDFAAFDSLEAYVRRYPDDPTGWYQLGDARFHAGRLGLHSIPEIMDPFLRAAHLDPAYGVGLVHAIELALDRGDREEFDRLLELYAPVGPADEVDGYRRQARVRWAPPDSLVHAFLAEARDSPIPGRAGVDPLVGVLGNRARLDLAVDPMAYVEALDSSRALYPADRGWQARAELLIGLNLLALGRAEPGLEHMETFAQLVPPTDPSGAPIDPDLRRAGERVMAAVDYGFSDSMVAGDLETIRAHLDEVPFFENVLHMYYLKRGRPDDAAEFTWDPSTGVPPHVDSAAVAAAFNGWREIVAGDTAVGVRRADEGLRRLGYWDIGFANPVLLDLAQALAIRPETRDRGIRMLRWSTMYLATEPAQAFLMLGRALEDEGDVEEAREAYAQVVRLWEGADAYRQDEVEEARSALVRLTREG
jgi:TolB-like protein